jgi:hypothetical protein
MDRILSTGFLLGVVLVSIAGFAYLVLTAVPSRETLRPAVVSVITSPSLWLKSSRKQERPPASCHAAAYDEIGSGSSGPPSSHTVLSTISRTGGAVGIGGLSLTAPCAMGATISSPAITPSAVNTAAFA